MKRWDWLTMAALLTLSGAMAAELANSEVTFKLSDKTGGLEKIVRKDTGKTAVTTENIYHLLAQSGDREARESEDVVRQPPKISKSEVVYLCENPKLPQFRITKRYWLEAGGLRRELTYTDLGKEPRYIMTFTESHFVPEMMEKGYYFGAGYLGPYRPAAKVKKPTRVDNYKQTSKGMVLTNRQAKRGSYAHYRVKINDICVLPWWQSTIGRYRELDDRLYYLPDGWRMCLGTLDPQPNGGSIRYTDCFQFFRGDILAFFSDVYGKDAEVMNDLKAIPGPSQPWITDLAGVCNYGNQNNIRYFAEMMDEGDFVVTCHFSGQWGDYRYKEQKGGMSDVGGWTTLEEMQEYSASHRAVTPRAHTFSYMITVAASDYSPIVKEHPEWFRFKDRQGNMDPLFPGTCLNYQTMMNNPDCRKFMANHLFDAALDTTNQLVYLDEAQQQNTINWQRNELIRDDHNILLWREMRRRSVQDKLPTYFNGSGQPYADVNWMEALAQLHSDFWRNFAGVALGLELYSQYRPDSRLALIGWGSPKSGWDYSNRVVALGWLASAAYPSPVGPVRASYEVGKTFQIPADYTPDWKKDYDVDVESYSVRRKASNDVIISLIQRSDDNDPIKGRVVLDTLGFAPNARINVWAVRTWNGVAGGPRFALTDAERRENFTKFGWLDSRITAPKLIYSGKPEGKLKYDFGAVARDFMVQLVFTQGPASIFAVHGVPQNYPFIQHNNVRITGKKFTSDRESTEILLADKELEFSDVTVDGKPVPVTVRDVGGTNFVSFSVPQGEHTLDWKTAPRKAGSAPAAPITAAFDPATRQITVSSGAPDQLYALEKEGEVVLTSASPLQLPERHDNGAFTVRPAGTPEGGVTVAVTGGQNTAHPFRPYPARPEKVAFKPANQAIPGGGKIIQSATGIRYSPNIRLYQENLEPSEAEADPEKLLLRAITTRRDDSLDTRTYAGFELEGVKQIRFKLTNRFFGAKTAHADKVHTYNGIVGPVDFAGIVLDYRVNGKYTHRVDLFAGLYSANKVNPQPQWWGTQKKQDKALTFGDLLNAAPEFTFSLDLEKYAPEGWDGTVWFTLGFTHILASRGLELTILEANNNTVNDFRNAWEPGTSGSERKMPDPCSAFRVKNAPKIAAADPAAWSKWADLGALQTPAKFDNAKPEQPTDVKVAYDDRYLYFGITAHDAGRTAKTDAAMPYENDDVELYYVDAKGVLVQYAVDALGKAYVSRNGDPSDAESEGLKVAAVNAGEKGFRVMLAVPWAALGYKEPYPGLIMPFNVCRVRRTAPQKEFSTWGPVDRLFSQKAKFGKIQLGKLIRGIGRYEEIEVDR